MDACVTHISSESRSVAFEIPRQVDGVAVSTDHDGRSLEGQMPSALRVKAS